MCVWIGYQNKIGSMSVINKCILYKKVTCDNWLNRAICLKYVAIFTKHMSKQSRRWCQGHCRLIVVTKNPNRKSSNFELKFWVRLWKGTFFKSSKDFLISNLQISKKRTFHVNKKCYWMYKKWRNPSLKCLASVFSFLNTDLNWPE
jgi:hypothetical protein